MGVVAVYLLLSALFGSGALEFLPSSWDIMLLG
jgi:hypothetical protein